MSAWLYSDYISIKEDFIPVYTKEQDTVRPGAWKAFIPHRPMRDLLERVTKAIERGPECKSIWMNGAYGTGKTFGVFAVKHILEDPMAEVDEYFSRYAQNLGQLVARLRALRENHKVLVVYTSSAAHINSHLDLLVELQTRVEQTLVEKGFERPTGASLLNEMLGKMRDSTSVFSWAKAFAKHANSKFGSYGTGEHERVLADLEALAASSDPLKAGIRSQLVRSVYDVFQEENIIIASDAERFKSWIQEVLDVNRNNFDSILFIWDEFTDYFVKNERLGWLQEIAQLSGKTPFYLLLVTHRSMEQLIRGRAAAEDYTKLADRFAKVGFEMTDITAYQLMANAILPHSERYEEWEDKKEALWPRIKNAVVKLKLLFQERASAEAFKELIPLHPFAGYLLALISRQFTSSERTLFKFLTDQREDSLGGFIQKRPSQGTYFYTADLLWDYFFASPTEEIGDSIRDLVSHYLIHADAVPTSVRPVFKAAVLILVLARQLGDDRQSGVVAPRLSCLRDLFEGTEIDVTEAFDQLCRDHLLNSYGLERSDDRGFSMPLGNVDETKLRQITGEIRIDRRFSKLAESDGALGSQVLKAFSLGESADAQHIRMRAISYDVFARQKDRAVPSAASYQIPVLVILVQDEQQLERAYSLCREWSQRVQDSTFITVDNPFGKGDWERWVDLTAHARYCETVVNDPKNRQFYSERAMDILNTWLRSAMNYHCHLFFRDKQTSFSGRVGFESSIRSLLDQVFPERPEREFQTNTLYKTTRYGARGGSFRALR